MRPGIEPLNRSDVGPTERTQPTQPTQATRQGQPTPPAQVEQPMKQQTLDLLKEGAAAGGPGQGAGATDPGVHQAQPGGMPDTEVPADPTGSLDAVIADAVAGIGPDALRGHADMLAHRLTTDRSLTTARLVVLLRERLSHALCETLDALAAPIVPLRERLLFMPVAGQFDGARARVLTERLLEGIHAQRARAVVIDLAGVTRDDPPTDTTDTTETTDTTDATRVTDLPRETDAGSRLAHAIRAARLLGANVIITGASPALAGSVLRMANDSLAPRFASDLSEGIREAERLLDHNVTTTTIAQDARWSTDNA